MVIAVLGSTQQVYAAVAGIATGVRNIVAGRAERSCCRRWSTLGSNSPRVGEGRRCREFVGVWAGNAGEQEGWRWQQIAGDMQRRWRKEREERGVKPVARKRSRYLRRCGAKKEPEKGCCSPAVGSSCLRSRVGARRKEVWIAAEFERERERGRRPRVAAFQFSIAAKGFYNPMPSISFPKKAATPFYFSQSCVLPPPPLISFNLT